LAQRLNEHTTQNKDRSIFRKHIGRALLSRDHDPFLDTWDLDLTRRQDRNRYNRVVDPAKLDRVEQAVSDYIEKHVCVSVIATPSGDTALKLERLCIATVSLCGSCRPSGSWLGNFSPNLKIQASGLWQLQHLFKQPLSAAELLMIERLAFASV
jgi:hypothetical protein